MVWYLVKQRDNFTLLCLSMVSPLTEKDFTPNKLCLSIGVSVTTAGRVLGLQMEDTFARYGG
jgi:hypothetical protein